jgi:hypothetical protein
MFDSLRVVGVAFVNDETLQPHWEALQATYAAEPFAAPIPIIACLPIFIFLPIAIIEIDSMKT